MYTSKIMLIPDYIEEIERLIKENQELKKKYENAVADYETTMAEKNKLKKKLEVPETCNLKTLEDYKSYYEDTTREQILEDTYIEYCAYVNLAHRYSELEKQLKDKTEDYRRMKDNFDSKVDVLTEIDTQQKEFIKYLEDEIEKQRKKSKTLTAFIRNTVPLQQCLQKYIEIIGDINDKK